jgi:hypothetical protein
MIEKTASSDKSKKRFPLGRLLLVLGILLGAVVAGASLLGLTVLVGGVVQGEEFCPDDFSKRTFFYFELPFFKKQLTAVQHEDSYAPVSADLIGGSYLRPAPTPKTWHLIYDNRTPSISPECDARILDQYLEQMTDSYAFFWNEWTSDHPKHAVIFWPIVSSLAKDNLYVDIPPVMDAAANPGDVTRFQSEIEDLVAQIYMRRAADMQRLDEHQRAVDFIDRAISLGYDKDLAAPLRQSSADHLKSNASPPATSVEGHR